jgi:hypothetical protein
MSYVYLASPYSDPRPEVRAERYERALLACNLLLRRKIWVHSPIVHCHDLAIAHEMPVDFSFWEHYNQAMIEPAKSFAILMEPGWETSRGIAGETAYAKHLQKPILACLLTDTQCDLYPLVELGETVIASH